MRLSEAIRLGSVHFRQVFGNRGDCVNTACALSAGYGAAGVNMQQPLYPLLWEWTAETKAQCPACPATLHVFKPFTSSLIPHLNDKHRWTFTQIADFIASIEPQDEPQVQVQAAPALVAESENVSA